MKKEFPILGINNLSLTKKLFILSLIIMGLSISGGLRHGFITEFPFPGILSFKFSTFLQLSITSSSCLGILMLKDRLEKAKEESKEIWLMIAVLFLLVSGYEVFLGFNDWFSLRRKGKLDTIRITKAYMEHEGVINLTQLENRLNISIPEQVLFPIITSEKATFNFYTKMSTAFMAVSFFGVLIIYQALLDEK